MSTTTTYKVAFKGSTRQALIMSNASATPAGYVSWGTFQHTEGPEVHDSRALYHAVQHLAYKAGEQNMQGISITTEAGINIPAPNT